MMGSVFSSIFWLIVTLGVLVTFHELGHFLMARLFGVKVLRFSVGFGKPIWSRFDCHGTEIAVAPIPLGGYVKLLDVRDCEVADADQNKTYNFKPAWQKFLIMFAGPAFNFILAFALYWLMFVVGKPEIAPTLGQSEKIMAEAGFAKRDQIVEIAGQPIHTWTDVSMQLITAGLDREDVVVTVKNKHGAMQQKVLPLSKLPIGIKETQMMQAIGLQAWQLPVSAEMGELEPELPAAQAGLKKGDVITRINDKPVNDWYQISTQISQQKPPLTIGYLRNGQADSVTIVTMATDPDNPKRQIIGIRPVQPDAAATAYAKSLYYDLSYGPVIAIGQAYQEMLKITGKSLEMMGKLLVGKASLENLSGPITIAQVASDSAARGFSWYLSFLALISLSLGIINLMPVPMLDGGQILFLVFEKIKGAPLSERFEMQAQMLGLFLLICLMTLAFYNDILRSLS